jgi:predicted DNA-binding ribbon-helix-helix protein
MEVPALERMKMTQASSFCKPLFSGPEPAQIRFAMPGLRKRSVLLTGHATSIALEPAFWTVLDEMARAERLSLAGLVGRIDEARGASGLASACRLAALKFAQSR